MTSRHFTADARPLVTAVIPVYNHEKFVGEAIRSVIDQDYSAIELVVINDGSSDSSHEQILALKDQCEERFLRFSYLSRENMGLCDTLNEALLLAKGNLFAVCASDDRWLPKKTSVQVDYMRRHPNTAGVFAAVQFIDETGEPMFATASTSEQFDFADIYLQDYSLPAVTQLVRTEILRDLGGWDKSLVIEDWSMWLAITAAGHPLDCMPLVLAEYRRHDNNFSNRLHCMHEARLKIVERYKSVDSVLYQRARSICWLYLAGELSAHSKADALTALREARHLWKTGNFYRVALRILAPNETFGIRRVLKQRIGGRQAGS